MTTKHVFLTAIATAALAPLGASAIDLLNTPITNAAGNCQTAMPVYDTDVRKRPLAVVNEGTTSAYITCSLTTDLGSLGVISYGTKLSNEGSSSKTINCTAVTGEETSAQYYPKSVNIPAGAQAVLEWTALDNGGLVFEHPVSLSCLLPPDTGLNENWSTYLLQLL